MAIGSTPTFAEDLYFEDLSPRQFLILGIETAKSLNWRIDLQSEAGFIAFTNAGRLRWNANFIFELGEEKARIKSESAGNEIWDLGRNRKTVNKFSNAFAALRNKRTPEELDQRFEEIRPGLTPKEQVRFSQPPEETKRPTMGDFFTLFKPQKGYFITPILVDLNILVFLLMILTGVSITHPDSETLIRWGANFRPRTLDGEWWRLLTNCFIHIGVIHLLFNMYALLYIGVLLEPRMDKLKFAAAYVLTGIAASVSSLWWHELTVSAGASGSIFGMYGLFLAMLTTNLIEKTARRALLISISIFVGYNLLNGVNGGIDNAAHVGGLLSGLIIGYVYYPSLKKPGKKSLGYWSVGLLAVFFLLSSFYVLRTIPNDIPRYDEKMKQFGSNESQALELFGMLEHKSKDSLLYEIKERDLYYWNENTKLIEEAEKLKIPEVLHERNKKLLAYCELRIKSYNLIYKMVEQDTDIYKDSLDSYNSQIEALIKSLRNK